MGTRPSVGLNPTTPQQAAGIRIDPPESVRELRATLDRFLPELRGSDAARDAARFLLREPPLPVAAQPSS